MDVSVPRKMPRITLIAASGLEPSESPATVRMDSAARMRWPFEVVKKLASGVPKCGVFIIVTVRKRGNHSSVTAVAPQRAGDATSRASSPPVE